MFFTSYQFIYLTFQKLEYKKFLIGIILWMAPGVGPFCRVSPSAWMSLFLAWRRRKKTFGNDCRGRLCEPIKEELTLLFRLCIFRNKMSTWFPASCVLIGSYLTVEKEEENDDVSNKLRGCVLMKFQLKISFGLFIDTPPGVDPSFAPYSKIDTNNLGMRWEQTRIELLPILTSRRWWGEKKKKTFRPINGLIWQTRSFPSFLFLLTR